MGLIKEAEKSIKEASQSKLKKQKNSEKKRRVSQIGCDFALFSLTTTTLNEKDEKIGCNFAIQLRFFQFCFLVGFVVLVVWLLLLPFLA